MKTLITHNGKFHADDIFACAVIQLHLDMQNETYTVIRTRDANQIAVADYVFDVGGEYDAARNRFDHHQVGGVGVRANGIPYAAAGLTWMHLGEYVAGSKEIAEYIDSYLIQPIDADDMGIDIVAPRMNVFPFRIQEALYAFRPTWKEDIATEDPRFMDNVMFAKKLLERLIAVAKDMAEAQQRIQEAYNQAEDQRMIVLDAYYPLEGLMVEVPKLIYVVRPRDNDMWGVSAIKKSAFSFENKKDFPKEWAGLRDDAIAEISGVPDAIFCHTGRFLAVARSQKGAIELAKKALEA